MNKISLIIILALILPLTAIADDKKKKKKKTDQEITETEILNVQPPLLPPPPPPLQPASGSLYTEDAGRADLVSDFKARHTGDLVFIDIVETSVANVSSNARRGRDSGTLGGIGTLAGALPLPGAAVAAGVVGALGIRKFEGKGATGRESDLRARIVARVVQVLSNGDLYVQGYKLVKINKESEWIAISGIVRQRDVAADNSVPTTVVGNLRVELNGRGVASADNAPGWLYRLFEKITPF